MDGAPIQQFKDTTHIPSVPMFLIANLAVGGDWPGVPRGATVFPAYFDIDYISVADRGHTVVGSATPAQLLSRPLPAAPRRNYLPFLENGR